VGHKGCVLRPRCSGPRRARTQILFYSILFSLLYNGYRVFPRCKVAGVWHWPPTPI